MVSDLLIRHFGCYHLRFGWWYSACILPSPDMFPRVQVRETVMVSFESDDGKDRIFVALDRATGDFIGGGATMRDKG
jgi:hypothetical protein